MYLFGLDIGGTKCAVTLGQCYRKSIKILGKKRFETLPSPYDTLQKMLSCIEELLVEHTLIFADIAAAGISCGGPLDPEKGVILSPPNLPGWDSIPVVEFFQSKTGIRCLLQNDANACAVAEWKLGAGRGFRNLIFLTFGTGLGAGLILDGRLYSGTNGNAGEAGHIRLAAYGPAGYGKVGSFEGFCSGNGIAQLGKTLAIEALQKGIVPSYCRTISELDTVTAKTVGDAADEGDETARSVYRLSGEMLGQGLSVLVDILNPERIIIGSVYTRSQHLLTDSCDAVMRRECLSLSYDVCRVVPAELGERIGDYAALSLALSAAT